MAPFALLARFRALPIADRRYFLRRFVDQKLHLRSGFSQFGEDASIAAYFRTLGRHCGRYVDIGANHPVLHSNTYLFYRDGGSGVLVEANPVLARRLRRKRPRDKVVNVGIVPEGSGTMDLQVMDMDGLSTLSDSWGKTVQSGGMARVRKTVSVPVVGINAFLASNVEGEAIDFASIDIEGLDFEVLSAWDFDRWRPFLLCAETAEARAGEHRREVRLYDLMRGNGYEPLFETFANTIFVDRR